MRKLFLLVLSVVFLNALFAQRVIIHCGQLIDVKNLQVLKDMSIIVDGNKIVDVQKGYLTAAINEKIIDLKSKTVMPGLIDMHVHLKVKPTLIITLTALPGILLIMPFNRWYLRREH